MSSSCGGALESPGASALCVPVTMVFSLLGDLKACLFKLLFFFSMWTILKVFIEFVAILLPFYGLVFLAVRLGGS